MEKFLEKLKKGGGGNPRKKMLKYNYLNKDPALALVKCLDSIDEMWLRLKKAYGDPKTLLHRCNSWNL